MYQKWKPQNSTNQQYKPKKESTFRNTDDIMWIW